MINIKPKFLNDSGVASFLVILLFAFILSTSSIAYFMGQIYGISVIAPELTPSGLNIDFDSHQNFKDCSADIRTTSTQMNSIWNYTCEIGMELKSNLFNLDSSYGYLLMNNIQKDTSGLYQNTYIINNTATNLLGKHGSYCLALKYTGGMGHNEVCFWDDGIHIPRYGLNLRMYTGDVFYAPYENINQLTHPKIKTVYKDAQFGQDFYVQVYLNDEKIVDTNKLNPEDNIAGFFIKRYYGGVSSATPGFALEDFNTEGELVSIDNSSNGLTEIIGFLVTIWKLATFSLPSTISFPHQISFLFDILIVGIFVCIVVILRGSA